jgi:hypothetical protein
LEIRSDGEIVEVVGQYDTSDFGTHAFVYSPLLNPNECTDLNEWFFPNAGEPIGAVPMSLPAGYYLKRATDINNYGVVVGYLKCDEPLEHRGFVLDLRSTPPVLDLLPTAGCPTSAPWRINENGDIVISYEIEPGRWAAALFNPGCYGDPSDRIYRDATPIDFNIDFSPEDIIWLPTPTTSDWRRALNNPTAERGAQVVGRTDEGVPFCYTVGDPEPLQYFGFQCQTITSLNDNGVFSGGTLVPFNRNKTVCVAYRHDESMDVADPGLVPGHKTGEGWVTGMNNSGDLVTRTQLYRDDWNGWIDFNDLVVGDLDRWISWSHLLWPPISDRIPVVGTGESAGIIAAPGWSVDDLPSDLMILTPVPAE